MQVIIISAENHRRILERSIMPVRNTGKLLDDGRFAVSVTDAVFDRLMAISDNADEAIDTLLRVGYP
jgi:hypothetical protein